MITAATCLAMALYYEARSEGVDGMMAVAEVVTNRVIDPSFPNDVCSVVKEDRGPRPHDCQFSFYCDGLPERPRNKAAWVQARLVAAEALNGTGYGGALGHGALYYHADTVRPHWAASLSYVGRVGAHLFYAGDCRLPLCSPVPKSKPKRVK